MTPRREEPVSELGRSQIPHGVQDRFLVEAVRRRQAEARCGPLFCPMGLPGGHPADFRVL